MAVIDSKPISIIGRLLLLGAVSLVSSAVTNTVEFPKEIPEGFDVDFMCSFPEVADVASSIHWTIPGISGQTLQESMDRYVISSSVPTIAGGQGWSKLTVTGADDSDNGRYRCQLLDGIGELVATSDTGLSVVRFDTATQSACWVEPTSTMVAGIDTEFKCATRQTSGKPPHWVVGTADLEGKVTITQNLTFINQTLEVPVRLNEDEFSCVSGSTTLCSTRVSLLYPPIVTVSAVGEIVYGDDAEYICTATGEPSHGFEYRWWYADVLIIQTSHHRFNRVLLQDGNQTLVLPDLSETFDADIELTCEVTNAVGTGRSEPFTITGDVPPSAAQTIGPIFVGVIFVAILIILLWLYCWHRSQRRVVHRISTKRKAAKVKRSPSELPTSPYVGNGSFVPVSPMDLEAIGYGPDTSSSKPSTLGAVASFDRDSGVGDDGIRPIPSRRGSMSSYVGRTNKGYEDDEREEARSEFSGSQDAPADPYELKMKSYSYEVNPNYNTLRRSQTLDIVTLESKNEGYDTENRATPSDSDSDEDHEDHEESATSGIHASTEL